MSDIAHSPLAVLLDLGGVLIDVQFERALQHWHACAKVPARVRQARSHGGAASHDLAVDMVTDTNTDLAYERHERGEIDFAHFAKALDDKLQLKLNETHWRQGWNAALGDSLPGAAQLVRSAAKQWPVFLFSNTNATHHAHWRAQHQQLLAPMRTLFVSNELGLRKPDPLAYRAVAAQIGIDAHRIAFFDDREQNVDGARQAGLQAFQANGPADVARSLGLDLSSP